MDAITQPNSVDLLTSLQSAQETLVEDHEKADDVAQKFEALLLFTMMKSMRSSLSEDTLTGSDQQNMYREMMDREIAELIADGGGLGLQKMLMSQLAPKLESSDEIADTSSDSAALKQSQDYEIPPDSTSIDLSFLTRHRMLQTTQAD